MKKSVVNVMLGLAIFSISSLPALAQEHNAQFSVKCPVSGTKGDNLVENYGNFIAGPGTLSMSNDIASQPLFEAPIVQGANIPTTLSDGGYNNNGVTYNPSNGAVTCYYQSTKGFDPFLVSYFCKNSLDGVVYFSNKNEIRFKIPMGVN